MPAQQLMLTRRAFRSGAIALGAALVFSAPEAMAGPPDDASPSTPPLAPVALPPMWPYQTLPPLSHRPKPRSLPMMITGIVFSAASLATIPVGLVLTVHPPSGALCGGYAACGLIVMNAGSIVLAGIGIPLWAYGGSPPRSWEAPAHRSLGLPTVTAGPRSVTLGWSF